MFKKLLAVVLCGTLIATLLPVGSRAVENTKEYTADDGNQIIEVIPGESNWDETEAEELFSAYVEKQFFGGPELQVSLYGASDKISAGAGLRPQAQKAYAALKEKIKNVALVGGSTQFVLTAQDLGAPSEILPLAMGLSDYPTPEVVNEAINSTYGEYILNNNDMSEIYNALMADLPLEMYWLDKTNNTIYSTGLPISYGVYTSGPNSGKVALDSMKWSEDPYYITIPVWQEFAVNQYMVASKIGSTIQQAQKVVNNNASKTPYQKLVAYRDYICDAVEYNHDALNVENNYGNPWQLLYVFDENKNTNVVCEGYAKAFKYLCDLSDIDCIIATGIMGGGTGSGGHMWNIVTLGDKNYLVDVTNCDGNSIGANGGKRDGLFMRGKGNEGGTWDKQYTYTFSGKDIWFTYADDLADSSISQTKDTYTQARLTLSDSDYTEKTVNSIAIKSEPTKKDYYVGDNLDTTGLSIEITYADSSNEIKPYDAASMVLSQTTPFNAVATGKEITVTYGGQSNKFTVNVKERTLQSIAIKTQPNKKSYLPTETFDSTGMVINAVYDEGVTVEVKNGYTISYPTSGSSNTSFEDGDTEVTISYTVGEVTKTTTLSVTVTKGTIEIPENLTWAITTTEYNGTTQNNYITTQIPSTVNVTYTGGSAKDVGSYTTTAKFEAKDSKKYEVSKSSVTKDWDITKKAITVRANNLSVQKSTPGATPVVNLTNAYTVTPALFAGDTLTGSLTCAEVVGDKLKADTEAGTYDITAGSNFTVSGANAGNYNVTFVEGALTVTLKKAHSDNTPVTVDQTYGNSYTIPVAHSGLTYTSDKTAVAEVSPSGVVTIKKSGTVDITVSGSYETDTDYYTVNKVYTINVAKKGLIVKPNDISITKGSSLPTSFTWNYSGLVGDDRGADIVSGGELVIADSSGAAIENSDTTGTYTLIVNNVNIPEDERYIITKQNGTLTISGSSSYRPVTPSGGGSSSNNTNNNTNNTTQATISSDKTSNVNTTVSGSNVAVSNISATTVNSIANSASSNNNTISIDVSKVSKETVSSVTITKETASNLASALDSKANKAEAVEIKMTNFAVTLDSTALSGLAKAGTDNVKLVVDTVATSSLNANQRTELAKNTVVETFEAHFETAVGQRITGITGNMTIGRIGFKAESGRSVNFYHVIYLPTTGEAVRHKTYYKDGYLLFDTNHNSEYAIVYDEKAANATAVPVYRLYNNANGDHFYTTHVAEYEYLVKHGLQDEKVAFQASVEEDAVPVYRLYNPNSGEHFYTASVAERNNCIKHNWNYEGIEFRTKGNIPVYRVYNPGGLHLLTMKLGEVNKLTKLGWLNEGVAFHVGR